MNKLQKYVQEQCIRASHPECKTLDEAKEKELGIGCVVYVDYNLQYEKPKYVTIRDDVLGWTKDFQESPFREERKLYGDIEEWYHIKLKTNELKSKPYINANEIIGQPPTLARILNALTVTCQYRVVEGLKIICVHKDIQHVTGDSFVSMDWKFLKEEGTDCDFCQQSLDTQNSIAKLLGYKKD